MPNINGGRLVHLPGAAEEAAKARASRKYKSKPKRAWDNFKNNRASKPAAKDDSWGDKFGQAPPKEPGTPKYKSPHEQHIRDASRKNIRILGGVIGYSAGAGAGTAVGSAHGKKKYPESKELYKGVKNPFKVADAPHLITDMGTAAGRADTKKPKKQKLWPEIPRKTIAASAAVGATLGYQDAKSTKKAEAQIVRRKKRKAALVAKRDPFNVEKLRPKPTPQERKNVLYNKDLMGGGKYNKGERKIASKIVGKEQGKGMLKGAGAGAAGGAALGAAVGVASKGKFRPAHGAIIGGAAGALGGEYRGIYSGNIKGQRKAKQVLGKNMTISAFGVDHGEVSKAAGVTPMKPIQPPKPGTQAPGMKKPKKPTIGGGGAAKPAATGPLTAALSSKGQGFGMGGSYSVFKPPTVSKAKTVNEQVKSNKRRSNAMMGTVLGMNAGGLANVAHKRVKLHGAVKDFNNRTHNDLGQAFKASHNVNQAARGVHRAGKIGVGLSLGSVGVAGATGAYNEKKYKQAKAQQ